MFQCACLTWLCRSLRAASCRVRPRASSVRFAAEISIDEAWVSSGMKSSEVQGASLPNAPALMEVEGRLKWWSLPRLGSEWSLRPRFGDSFSNLNPPKSQSVATHYSVATSTPSGGAWR